jgi:hypothetical protein
MLVGLLLVVAGADVALFYAIESVSARDYSVIADPQLRVGYCMVASTTLSEKYLLAESAARPEDPEVVTLVMSHALAGEISEEKQSALLALKVRAELKQRAIRSSFLAAESCGYRQVSWPSQVTPLDTSLKWLQYDSTFSFFMAKVRAEPDAAERFYRLLQSPGAEERNTNI